MNNPIQSANAYHSDSLDCGNLATRKSACVVAPLIVEKFTPHSVVDVGCGLGDWLAEFRRLGCSEVVGYDGEWVPRRNLQIPPPCFRAVDFTKEWEISGKFDLGICFEVAEHFDEASGERLVRNLSDSARVVVFGAAIPQQGGYQHVNEQFQSYWITKFKAHGLLPFDLIRPLIWGNEACDWWYQQNILVFLQETEVRAYQLSEAPFIADIVHPKLYDWHRDPQNWGGREMLKLLVRKIALRTKGVFRK